jgi:hypothetical protein
LILSQSDTVVYVPVLRLAITPSRLRRTTSLNKSTSRPSIYFPQQITPRRALFPGISQLHEASLIDWDVAPAKKSNKLVQMDRNTEVPNHARDNSSDIKAKIKVLDDASKARGRAEADSIISSAISLAQLSAATIPAQPEKRKTMAKITSFNRENWKTVAADIE